MERDTQREESRYQRAYFKMCFKKRRGRSNRYKKNRGIGFKKINEV